MLDRLIWKIRAFFTPISMGAADVPDARDYNAGIPKVTRLPKKVDLYAKAKKFGWKPRQQTKNACTAYASGFAIEIMNTIDNEKLVIIDVPQNWLIQQETTGSVRNGDLIQNALKTIIKNPQGFPSLEYRRIKSREIKNAKKWLALGVPIVTGVHWRRNNAGLSNWTKYAAIGVWNWIQGRISGGHCKIIIGYDDEKQCFLSVESLLDSIEHEYQEIPYEDFLKTMSWYVFRDLIDR